MKTLKELRQKFGYTQKELATLVDVANATVSLWECGRVRVGQKNREKLRKIFKTNDILFDIKPEKKPSPSKKKTSSNIILGAAKPSGRTANYGRNKFPSLEHKVNSSTSIPASSTTASNEAYSNKDNTGLTKNMAYTPNYYSAKGSGFGPKQSTSFNPVDDYQAVSYPQQNLYLNHISHSHPPYGAHTHVVQGSYANQAQAPVGAAYNPQGNDPYMAHTHFAPQTGVHTHHHVQNLPSQRAIQAVHKDLEKNLSQDKKAVKKKKLSKKNPDYDLSLTPVKTSESQELSTQSASPRQPLNQTFTSGHFPEHHAESDAESLDNYIAESIYESFYDSFLENNEKYRSITSNDKYKRVLHETLTGKNSCIKINPYLMLDIERLKVMLAMLKAGEMKQEDFDVFKNVILNGANASV